MDEIFEKVQAVVDRYDEISELLSDPAVIGDTNRFMALSKEEGSLRDTVDVFRRYKKVVEDIESDNELLREKLDPDMEELTKDELKELTAEKEEMEAQLKVLLLPKDPNDDKNIIMEIHGAAGGEEAALFAADLYNMYARYAEKQGWQVEIIDENKTEIGGYKEVVLMITGNNVYSKLKFENGAHRVQRVPETETAGRVHTSTATVGVMPEYEDVDITIEDKDLRVDVFRASGAGGQHINKTSSAVRMTHLPTGIVVSMQDQRSQQQNRTKAMEIMKARVYDFFASQNEAEYAEQRKTAVGTGDRSERIRTYNYPQNRVTDHRIGLSLSKLDRIVNGELDDIIDALVIADQTAKLEALKN
ncbi:peptide chain release factor 1 [Weissella soli]|uniref:Peptide chain release factor 1 n=1 Tax=Weissella soli TaxID=155866 RepID=A0A288Q5B1_9LACO|nr:peptide chain release factor 1 [Weissella soli]AOT55707.1 Peptide chain release factor [Weissella soli]NKY83520.1 peptide chain release factor 1 [Weissella soli]QEA35354.1 peptide chain release factor 1 [Weissella soli]RDL06619.1 peptide chain release factor 1 (bRF-1) [Weissella soli]GEN93329.1 peptide chain release factor 1 [Weissella soli]